MQVKHHPNTWLYVLIGSLIAAIILVAAYILLRTLTTRPPRAAEVAFLQQDENFTGITEIEPARAMPDFTLTSHSGAAIKLSDLQGKFTLITFGFTNCPDICPLTLNEMRHIHSKLGALAADFNFVFISIDGARDTPAALRDYFEVQQVDSFMIGMTGSEDDLRRIGVDYGLQFIFGDPNESGWYNIDHTAGWFLLDENSNWIKRYTFGIERPLIENDLRAMTTEG